MTTIDEKEQVQIQAWEDLVQSLATIVSTSERISTSAEESHALVTSSLEKLTGIVTDTVSSSNKAMGEAVADVVGSSNQLVVKVSETISKMSDVIEGTNAANRILQEIRDQLIIPVEEKSQTGFYVFFSIVCIELGFILLALIVFGVLNTIG